jgi:hypothetical protein
MARPKANERKTAPRKETVKKISKTSSKKIPQIVIESAIENSDHASAEIAIVELSSKRKVSIEHCKSWSVSRPPIPTLSLLIEMHLKQEH